jgi:hypothetical protein
VKSFSNELQAQETAMAIKKKSVKRSVKKVVRPRNKAAKLAPPESFAAQPELESPARSMMGPMSYVIILVVVVALIFVMQRKPEVPSTTTSPTASATKVDAGLQVAAAPTAVEAQAVATPQKRSSSPDGPRVWDRSKVKAPVRFFVVREKDSFAEVSIFKAGNVLIRDLKSDQGPRQTVQIRWDGNDASGNPVDPGSYYARITGAHGDMVEELLVK